MKTCDFRKVPLTYENHGFPKGTPLQKIMRTYMFQNLTLRTYENSCFATGIPSCKTYENLDVSQGRPPCQTYENLCFFKGGLLHNVWQFILS